ncbi:hypothetical protein AGR8A_Lc10027 [Agrobacterium fabrum str. J-07]|nr:hypothetical protein AGR8A_Lc10027 [Agrobacterium fabrum str. J-07]
MTKMPLNKLFGRPDARGNDPVHYRFGTPAPTMKLILFIGNIT